uniref:Bcl2 modifying factor n=1 Tax=Gasterosteus aculeatus aculeatus TaxID=481459 RepID=A0AAQ4NZY0_GASAC
MDDEEDDVFEPDPDCWRTAFREVKCQDRGTQTPGPAPAPDNGMLPCGVAEEPRQLFYGNAAFRLHFPANFELVGDQEARPRGAGGQRGGMERPPRQQPAGRSVEACIGQKLQLIGDQFHRQHLQLYHRNQRNRGGAWWRLAVALLSALFDRGFVARGGGAGRSPAKEEVVVEAEKGNEAGLAAQRADRFLSRHVP